MGKVGNMTYYTHEEMLDRVIGKRGTPRREKIEADLEAFLIAEAIRRRDIEDTDNKK